MIDDHIGVVPAVTELITCCCLEQETVTSHPERYAAAAKIPALSLMCIWPHSF